MGCFSSKPHHQDPYGHGKPNLGRYSNSSHGSGHGYHKNQHYPQYQQPTQGYPQPAGYPYNAPAYGAPPGYPGAPPPNFHGGPPPPGYPGAAPQGYPGAHPSYPGAQPHPGGYPGGYPPQHGHYPPHHGKPHKHGGGMGAGAGLAVGVMGGLAAGMLIDDIVDF